MTCQLEEKIEISFDISSPQPHTKCDQKYCIDKGGEICISKEFKEYLEKNFKIDKFLQKPELEKNDLQWLLDNDRNIRKVFTSSDGYRLRFKEHDKIACDFINRLFQYYQKPVTGKFMYDGKPFIDSFNNQPKHQELASYLYYQLWENNILWGETFDGKTIKTHENHFLYLSENARKNSASEIYRLHDLANKYDNNYQLKLTDFLALLYALKYGNSQRQKPESISEFVSYFEFYKQLSDDYRKIHVELAKKDSLSNALKRGILDNFVYLVSDEGIAKANEVWDLYYETAKNLFGEEITFDPSLTDEEFVKALRCHLQCTPSPFPIRFSSLHSAAYHAFKHKDLCNVPAEELPVCSYLETIREIVLNGTALPARPDQFGKGRLFTFEKKLEIEGRMKNVTVFLLKGDQRNTFILSCH